MDETDADVTLVVTAADAARLASLCRREARVLGFSCPAARRWLATAQALEAAAAATAPAEVAATEGGE